jgi:hypothetical protein
MRRSQLAVLLLVMGSLVLPRSVFAGPLPNADFKPDPKSVERYGPAYRYPQAGWIVLHIEGEPYARGYQHGRLMAPEIAGFLRCYAAIQSSRAPSEGWKLTRTLVNALFVRRYHKEYLEEMKGIADGATAAGARFDNRPIDLVDIVALNSWPEVETLDSALGATATGLEGIRFKHEQPLAMPKAKPMHCSAFAATGPATADGKVVFGHITMFGLYPSLFYNVWLDVKPSKGHRVLMQTYPGGMQSGMDYYLNGAGLIVCETTIAQTKLDSTGLTVASRIRQALQYADSIDKAVEILKNGNNGLYTNEWLLADVKTNEIAMFELGTHKSKLYRSGKDEWPGGTKGFYWGCNNTKDLEVRLETVASTNGRPNNVVFRPSARDMAWLRLYDQHKGKIDAEFGKIAFTTPPIAAYHSLDAKFTTTDMAKSLKTWALFGPPLGRTWEPSQDERKRFPEVRPLVSNPWTVLHTAAPETIDLKGVLIADLGSSSKPREEETRQRERRNRSVASVLAWHGTLLPKTDADIWLAAAFAEYERIYSLEKDLKKQAGEKGLSEEDRQKLAVALYGYRSRYLAAARAWKDVALANTVPDVRRDEWYRIAEGRGVLLLHELRKQIGDARFEKAMDSFGREQAGQKVTTAEFKAHVEKTAEMKLDPFFSFWLNGSSLPRLHLDSLQLKNSELLKTGATPGAKLKEVSGTIRADNGWSPASLELTIETRKGEKVTTVPLKGNTYTIDCSLMIGEANGYVPLGTAGLRLAAIPDRVIVDKYGQSAKANGGVYSITSFLYELEQTLIVYGTADEVPSNREAAKALQKEIITAGSNQTVAIKSDKEVIEADLKSHHLLLIGRPDSNALVARFRTALPVTFGSRSFVVGAKSYAHAGSAVVVASENPLNKRYSMVVAAGLSAESTLRAASSFVGRGISGAEALLLANGQAPKTLVLPARELVKELAKR